MSEQPPSTAPQDTIITASSLPPASAFDFSVLDLNDIGPLLVQIEDVTHEGPLVTDREARLRWRDLVLAHQKEIDVVCRQGVVERRLDRIARTRRPHQARRDDDGKVGLVLLVLLAREQRAEHR